MGRRSQARQGRPSPRRWSRLNPTPSTPAASREGSDRSRNVGSDVNFMASSRGTPRRLPGDPPRPPPQALAGWLSLTRWRRVTGLGPDLVGVHLGLDRLRPVEQASQRLTRVRMPPLPEVESHRSLRGSNGTCVGFFCPVSFADGNQSGGDTTPAHERVKPDDRDDPTRCYPPDGLDGPRRRRPGLAARQPRRALPLGLPPQRTDPDDRGGDPTLGGSGQSRGLTLGQPSEHRRLADARLARRFPG
jgi:hypothetical protein